MSSPEGEAALVVRGLHKSFGSTRVLCGVDLDVDEGAIVAVLGPSGGGKTTLLRIVAGFEQPDAGTVRLRGTTVASAHASVPPERRRVGVVPQEGALFPHLTVERNVGFGLGRARDAAARASACLELVGLGGFERRRPDELSGGQQQRVALARALAPRPSLVVLDEPFASLDAALRIQVREDVCAALRAERATAVLVTHDQQEALSVADRVAVLLDGVVAQAGPPTEVYRHPVDLAVATFVGDAVMLPGRLDGRAVHTALGCLPVLDPPSATEVVAVVRPEQVVLSQGPGSVPAVVRALSFFGHDALVRLELAGGIQVAARLHAGVLPPAGGSVGVRVDGEVTAFGV